MINPALFLILPFLSGFFILYFVYLCFKLTLEYFYKIYFSKDDIIKANPEQKSKVISNEKDLIAMKPQKLNVIDVVMYDWVQRN